MSRAIEFDRQHFVGITDADAARVLFKKSVTTVIIELFSYCNRRCSYCPVSLVDRITTNKYLSQEIFARLISDLRAIEYDEDICLNLYNEPLAERDLLIDAIKRLRQAMPAARIYFSSNGDYLDRDYLNALAEAGLSDMYVTLHPPKDQLYSDLYCLSRFGDLSARLGIGAKFYTFSPNHHIEATFAYKGVKINAFSTNYLRYGQTRGGLIAEVAPSRSRSAPCARVFDNFTVSYDGSIFPCCQLFSDSEQHKQYAIGNLASFPSIFAAYADERFAGWRKGLLTYGDKLAPCDTCSEADEPGSVEMVQERNRIYEQLVGPLPATVRETDETFAIRVQGLLRRLVRGAQIGT